MKTLYTILFTANIFIHAGPKPDEYILAAYEEGRESIILEVIDNNGQWEIVSND